DECVAACAGLDEDERAANDGFSGSDGRGERNRLDDFGTRGNLLTGAFGACRGVGKLGGSVSFGPVAAVFNFATSSRVRLRQSPGGTSSASGPYCTRRIFSTWCP